MIENKLNEAYAALEVAQREHEAAALAVVEGTGSQKVLDAATKVLREADQYVSNLKAAQGAAVARDAKLVQDREAADAAAHRQKVNEAAKVIRAAAQEYDDAVDRLVTIGKQFEQARQQLYAVGPGAGVIRTIETGLMEIPTGIAFKLSALVGRNASPAFYSAAQSCLLSYMPSA